MVSLIGFGALGLGLGIAYTLALRQFTEQLVIKSGSAVSISISMAMARVLPIGFLILAGVVWDVNLALAGFGGFWLGRTGVLVLSFSRRLG